MKLNRRDVLGGAVAIGALSIAPRFAIAEIALQAGTVRTVSDGHLVLPASLVLGGLPQDELRPILERHDIAGDQLTPPCNLTLFQSADRTVLFDAGSGSDFMPTAGKLLESLDALGVSPDEITDVIFTHGHPDHLWGLLDDFDDPAFPEAQYFVGRDEWNYWTDPATVDRIDPARQFFAAGAKRRLDMIGDMVELFGDGDEILPGVAAVATHGHTPGHMSFELGGDGGVFVIGDAVTNHHVNFARPEWPSGSDQDPERGAQTRVDLMERLAANGQTLIGFHLPGGGIGRVERDGSAYRYVPQSA